jgi:chromosome segregation ATPase
MGETEDERRLIAEITRGFESVRTQIHERDNRVAELSEKMVGVEFKLDQLKETLTKLEADISKAENERMKLRVDNLEKTSEKFEQKQIENAKWIKGLIASVILLLVGFLLNFIRIGLR